jgi:hypothetical protein
MISCGPPWLVELLLSPGSWCRLVGHGREPDIVLHAIAQLVSREGRLIVRRHIRAVVGSSENVCALLRKLRTHVIRI